VVHQHASSVQGKVTVAKHGYAVYPEEIPFFGQISLISVQRSVSVCSNRCLYSQPSLRLPLVYLVRAVREHDS
jgi:hypothetical protein